MNDNAPPDPSPRPPFRMVRIIGTVSADSWSPADVVQIVPIPLELLGDGQEER